MREFLTIVSFTLLLTTGLSAQTPPLRGDDLIERYDRRPDKQSDYDFGEWLYRRAFRDKARIPRETRRLIQKLRHTERAFAGYLRGGPRVGLPLLTVGLFKGRVRLFRFRHGLNHDSVLPLASVSKILTATAILQLAEAGRLSLDDDIRRFLPNLPLAHSPRGGEPVTVADLLRHSSGIPYTGERVQTLRSPRRDMRFRIANQSRAAGRKAVYSNQNFYLLGAIIEAASGQPYPDYVTDNILRPSAMTRSRVAPRANAASGIFSTVNELLVFFRRLMHPERYERPFANANSLRRMTEVPPFENPARITAYWGLGVRVRYHAERRREIYHNGRWTGAGGRLGYFPDSGVYLVYLGTPDDFRDEDYKRFHFGIGDRAARYTMHLDAVLDAEW